MAFPDSPLGIRVEIQAGGVWLDISGDVLTAQSIEIITGILPEAAQADAGTVRLILRNTAGRYSPRNPRSDLFGLIGRNTPLRVSVVPLGTALVRFVGEVSEWPTSSASPFYATTTITASGILRRLKQGTSPLQSAVRREFAHPSRTSIVAYWPLEDGSAATEFASALPGAAPMRITTSGIKPGAYSAYAASDVLPTLGDGALTGAVPAYATTGQSALRLFLAAGEQAPEAEVVLWSLTGTGSAARWTVGLTPEGNLRLWAYAANGTQLTTAFLAFNVLGKRVSAGLDLVQTGADVAWRLYVIDTATYTYPGGGSVQGWSGTVAGRTVGRITHIGAGSSAGGAGEAALGHIALASATSAYGATGTAMIGWAGETAATRISRLGAEEQIPVSITAVQTTPSERVGAQTPAALLDLVQEAADADGGLLHESRDAVGLAYRTRSALCTQRPALVLDYAAGGIATPTPVDDDQTLSNDRTITRAGGSSARAVLESGPLSVLPPPNGVGRYTDAVTLSLHSDDQIAPQAWWRLHLGTWDEPRYPEITIALHQRPDLIAQVGALRVGDRITLANLPDHLPPGIAELQLTGYREVLDDFTWEVTLYCRPGGPYLVAVADDSEYAIAGSDGSELAGAVDATATQLDVKVTAGPLWPVAAVPLNLNPDMVDGLDGWAGFGGTVDRVPTPDQGAAIGPWAVQFTPNGTEQYPNAGSDLLPVTAGRRYTLSGCMRCATTRNVDLNANWFTVSGAYLATGANSQRVEADTWEWFERTFTAPAGAASANIAATVANYPPPADVLTATRVTLRPTLDDEMPDAFPIALSIGGEEVSATAAEPTTINVNPEVLVDADGWFGYLASIARVTDVVHAARGAVASLRVTPDGTSPSGSVNGVSVPGTVTPGTSFTAVAWVYSPAGGHQLGVCVDWIDASGAYMTTALGPSSSVPAATWVRLEGTFTAPAGTAGASVRARHTGTPPATAPWYAWGIRLRPVGRHTFTVIRGTAGLALAHPAGTAVQVARPAPAAL
ncbi:hypothetical protein AB0I27_06690 [Streptomyces sp. NPDC050597]|uniref:hypothetical protein n=1 Tax=Streptomyces sp. NPDC050597 TaxID=3157212 RepID=UPI00341CE360